MPERSAAASNLLEMHSRFIHAIETWIEGRALDGVRDVQREIHGLLGQPDAPKRFLAASLAAVLTAQRGNLQARI